MNRNLNKDTIVAVSTPVGEGGIGIVRLSGKDSVKIANRIFLSSDKRKPSKFKTHTVHYGHIFERSQRHKVAKTQGHKDTRTQVRGKKLRGKIVDEVLLTMMRAPKTYTKEDIVEINCHGGMTALKRVIELVVKNGARPAEPGEFTKRAFLNGRLDLTQAEAVLDIITAKTDAGLRVSINQLEGELSKEINLARNRIIDISADVEAAIDFPEEDIEVNTRQSWFKKVSTAKKRLTMLVDTYHHGSILKEGITAVICGRANVGKSSLMNLLLKRDRVIVTHIPGTTRDAIEEMVNIKGIPIKLVDTAGLRKGNGIVEKAGIDKSRSYLSNADLIICILDGSERLKKDDIKLLKELKGRCAVIAINKCDLKLAVDKKHIRAMSKNKDVIEISCLKKEGIDRLEDKVYNKVWSGNVHPSHQLMLNNVRHKDGIEKAIASLRRAEDGIREGLSPEFLSIDIRESINALGEIVGQAYTDDILNVIFSKFCIGK
jgi:tRNA modification GTPase